MAKMLFLQTFCGRIITQGKVNMLSPSERCVIDLCCRLLTAQLLLGRKRHVGRAQKGRNSKQDHYLLFDTLFVDNVWNQRPNMVGVTCIMTF